MDKILLAGWLLVLVVAVSSEAAPALDHLYLGYVSPYDFLKDTSPSGGQYQYNPYRPKRSAMGSMSYDNAPMYDNSHHAHNMYDHAPMYDSHHAPMSYGHSFGYSPMFYPFKMFAFPSMKFPAMPDFPEMKFPAMPSFSYPSYSQYQHPFMNAGNFYNSGYNKPYQPAAHPAPAPAPHHPFGDHFMKMMGFHGKDSHDAHNNNNNGKGNNYEMSYSKSYNMNMDYTNGKGHMVTKDSSYMNDNGKIYMNNDPAKHYTANGEGKFVLDKDYNNHH